MKDLHWGILGTGAIAHVFAKALNSVPGTRLAAVGSRTPEAAKRFGETHSIPCCHESYSSLLADNSVQAIYISTPHACHAEWAIKAAEAGKHVLCEKPLAMSAEQGQQVLDAAQQRKVFLAEGFMYRFHPQTERLITLMKDGAIGTIHDIYASFAFDIGNSLEPGHRLLNKDLGGGCILDVGCYTVSAARLVAGIAVGLPFQDPANVQATGSLGPTGVEETARADLEFPSGLKAQLFTSLRSAPEGLLRVNGSKGSLLLPNPWVHGRKEAQEGKILIIRPAETLEEIVPARANSFTLEAEAVAKAIASGRQEPDPPGMTWEDSLGNLATLDKWRHALGLGL